jgi:hypothetical protein
VERLRREKDEGEKKNEMEKGKLEKLKGENLKRQASIDGLKKDVKEKEKERNKNAGDVAVMESESECESLFVCFLFIYLLLLYFPPVSVFCSPSLPFSNPRSWGGTWNGRTFSSPFHSGKENWKWN